MFKFITITLKGCAVALAAVCSQNAFAAPGYFNGFETDAAGWEVFGGSFNAVRVPSGTAGITSKTGSFHAQSTTAATNWGGYSSTFGPGYITSLDIYLEFGSANDQRFDFTSAINNQGGTHRRDFAFNGGYYNDSDSTGSGDRFVFSASNNTGRANAFPKNPGRDPFAITTEGWYTFTHEFRDDGAGVLEVELSILDSGGTPLHSWTLSDPADIIATQIGGNRYGWIASNELAPLALDNAQISAIPEPAAAGLLLLGAASLLSRRTRRA